MPDLGLSVCRVYWGSHGCSRPRGHEGPHLCLLCWSPDEDGWVGAPPYYGPETHFYGDDVEVRELDEVASERAEEITKRRLGRWLLGVDDLD